MPASTSSAPVWTFPIHLQGNHNSPPPGGDMEDILTATLEKIPGFLTVEKHSGAEQGIYLAEFEPAERSRDEIEDAIRASGYTVHQPSPDQDMEVASTPEG